MRDHPGLRHRERQERADREERNEPIGDAAEHDEQRAREHGKDDDALRVDETPAPDRERVRKKAVFGEHATDARKVGKARVRRKREHGHDRSNRQVVERAPPHDGGDQHRDDALVAGLSRIGRGDAVRAREVRDAREQDRQNDDDRGERALRVRDRRRPEERDAVADGLHAGHRGTAVRERPHQNPQRRRLRRRADGRRHDHRRRVTIARERLDDANRRSRSAT